MKNMVLRFYGHRDPTTFFPQLNARSILLSFFLFYFFDKSTCHTCDAVLKRIALKDPDLFKSRWSVTEELNKI